MYYNRFSGNIIIKNPDNFSDWPVTGRGQIHGRDSCGMSYRSDQLVTNSLPATQ